MRINILGENEVSLEWEVDYSRAVCRIVQSSFTRDYQLTIEDFLQSYPVVTILMQLSVMFSEHQINYAHQHTDNVSSLSSINPPFNVIQLNFGRDRNGSARKIRILRNCSRDERCFFIAFEHPGFLGGSLLYELTENNHVELSRIISQYSFWMSE